MILWFLLLTYHTALSFLYNLEEVEHLKYGIEMNSAPILRSQLEGRLEAVTMRSKYQQEYSCVLPSVMTKDTRDEHLEAVFTSFPAKFNSNHCLHRTKGWWTYRVCYGNIIQQYHQPDRRKQSFLPEEVMIIGYYERDMDWEEEINNPSIKYYEQLPHAHKQFFTKGDICDETGIHRKAVVSYVCDPDAQSDFIALIDEREVCSYRIVVHTYKMCKHDFFMPGHAAVKHQISCSPIVNSMPAAHPSRVLKAEEQYPAASPVEPNWVGANPTSVQYSLKEYIDDISNEEKQAPIRALKKMFKDAVKDMQSDISNKKSKPNAILKNPALENINLENLSEEDLNEIFQSEELEETINKLAKSTKDELEMIKMQAAAQIAKPTIEVKVIYRDANGDVKISNADGESPELKDTILQIMDYNQEVRDEQRRHQVLQNAYNFLEAEEREED